MRPRWGNSTQAWICAKTTDRVTAVRKLLLSRAAKPVLFLLAMLPVSWLTWGALNDGLGANPAEYLIRSTGDWALRMLCLVLAVTPLRQWTQTPALAKFRRMLGLFVYFYVCLHLLAYSWLDMGLEVLSITRDVVKRPFIFAGFLAFLILTPLAWTSFNRVIRWLGAARWKRLHQTVYVVPVLAVLHFFWMRAGKHNFDEVLVYAFVFVILLGWRVVDRFSK